jgi:chemotaxis protein MotB
MRRPRQSAPNADRWLISYADFVTLIFGLFVVLYAVAQSDRAKVKDLSQSVQIAFGGRPPARAVVAKPAIAQPVTKTGAAGSREMLASSYADLKERLRQEIADGKMQVRMDARGVIVSLHEKSFFPSGKDAIYPSAYESMSKVASVIRDLPNPVLLEGHTDSVPIHNQRFRSNWDLSAARSIAVLQFFETRYDIAPQRFAIAGYADNLPVAGNDSDEGRSRNRRVDIVISAR